MCGSGETHFGWDRNLQGHRSLSLQKGLAKKNLQLFHEIFVASGYPDVGLASNIARGFDLMGDIPLVGFVYPEKATHATLLPEQVRDHGQCGTCSNLGGDKEGGGA